MKTGDLVVVLGKIDQRIRESTASGLVIGTLDQFLCDDQVSVILENNDIWVGSKREIVLAQDQQ